MYRTNKPAYLRFVTVLAGVCLALGLLPLQPAKADGHVATPVFEHLALDQPELSAVRDAVEAGDPGAAAEALRVHFAERETPLFTPVTPGTSSSLFDSTAAELGAGIFRDSNGMERDFSDGVDWSDPWTEVEGELGGPHYYMQDFAFVPTLVGEYLALPEGDPQRAEIVATWMDLSLQYIDAFPEHGLYNRLGEAKRLTQWLTAFSVFRTDPTVDADELAVFLDYLHGSADNLFRNVESNNGNNWYISIGRAFYLASIYLPEFSDAPMWEIRAEGVADRFIARHLKGDGVQYEPALNYQYYSLSLLLQMEHFGKLNDRSPLGNNHPQVERLAEAVLGAMMPNLEVPLIGDTGGRSLSLASAADVFERDDMAWVASGRTEGVKPALGSLLFPQSFAVMRTGWDEDDSYMFINNQDTDYAQSHRHPDDLSLTLFAEGRELLVDPGVTDYNNNANANWLRRTTEAHNTVEIDGIPQPSMVDGIRERRMNAWETNDGFDYFSGSHDDYDPTMHDRSVYFSKPGVWIVNDRLTGGEAERSYRQLWHGPADAEVATADGRAQIGFGDVPGVVVADVDGTSVETYDHGRVADGYGELHEDVPFVAMEKSANGDTHFDTVLVAGPAGDPVEVTTDRIELGADPAEASAFTYAIDGTDSLFYRSDSTERTTRAVGAYETDASVMHVELGGSRASSLGVLESSIVTQGAEDLLRSDSPVPSLFVEWASTLKLSTSTPFESPIEVLAPGVTGVELNGQPIEYEKVGDHVRVQPGAAVVDGEVYEPALTDDLESESWEFSGGVPAGWDSVIGPWQARQLDDGTWGYGMPDSSFSSAKSVVSGDALDMEISATYTPLASPRTMGFGFVLRAQDNSNYHLVRLYRTSGGPLQAEVIDVSGGSATSIVSEPVDASLAGPLDLRAVAVGETLRLEINGETVLEAEDPTPVAGGYGLHIHRTNGTFTDVVGQLADEDPIQWDFKATDFDGWQVMTGDWQADEGAGERGALQGADTTVRGAIVMHVGAPRDVELETTLTYNGGADPRGAGVYVRYQDARNAYLMRIYRSSQAYQAQILRIQAGSETLLATKVIDFDPNAPVPLRAVAVGDRLEFWVDGERAVTAEDSNISAGSVALWTSRSDASFADVGMSALISEDWQVFRGGAYEGDGHMRLEGARPGGAIATTESSMSWDGVRVEATAEAGAGTGDVGIVTHASGASTGYRFVVGDADGEINARIELMNQGSRGTTEPVVLAEGPVEIADRSSMRLTAEAVDGLLVMKIDDVEVLRARNNILDAGGVGLMTTLADARFSDVAISHLVYDQDAGEAPDPDPDPEPEPEPGEFTSALAPATMQGRDSNAWGVVDGEASVSTQVQLSGGQWATSQTRETGEDGRFIIPLTYGKDSAGTLQWRVRVTYADGSVEYGEPMSQTRIARSSFAVASTTLVDRDSNAWGTVVGTATVSTQVRLANGTWSTSQTRETDEDGGYVIPLTYGRQAAGSLDWRVRVEHDDAVVEHSDVSTQRRLVRPTAVHAGSKPVGQPTYVWGSVDQDTPTRVFTQVYVDGSWSTSQVGESDPSGGYALELTYGNDQGGTYRYRVGADYPGVGTVFSDEFALVRTIR